MNMYPSLEDMKVDQIIKAQVASMQQGWVAQPLYVPGTPAPTAPPSYGHPPNAPPQGTVYPGLTDVDEYMGLQLTPQFVSQHMSNAVVPRQTMEVGIPAASNSSTAQMLAPLSGTSVGLMRSFVSHGVREVVICKDKDGKTGLKVRHVNNGVFVQFVRGGSPAALAGIRFGDQILQFNGEYVAGWDADKVHSRIQKSPANGITIVVRDRPFERTVTMHKDSAGKLGFNYRDGKITSIVNNSSAARNGLLTDHHMLEVDGQNVIGLSDSNVTKIMDKTGQMVTITIMPSVLYDHMMKNISSSMIKSWMDHSIPEV